VSDPRLTPANGRVAAASLRGQVEAQRFVEGEARRIATDIAELWSAPTRGERRRQLLYGETFTVYETVGARAFGQSGRDGHVGYVATEALAPPTAPTAPTSPTAPGDAASHKVVALATHLYSEASIRAPDVMRLYFGSRLAIVGRRAAGGGERFLETAQGLFVPARHVAPLDSRAADPVSVAQRFLGVPYLWGGNSCLGMDCSGLVQAAMLACGVACPGDSDLQEAALGEPLPESAPLERGDLVFWKGHVALVVDEHRLIHANGFDMAVAHEPVEEAIARIRAQGDGAVTSRRRVRALAGSRRPRMSPAGGRRS